MRSRLAHFSSDDFLAKIGVREDDVGGQTQRWQEGVLLGDIVEKWEEAEESLREVWANMPDDVRDEELKRDFFDAPPTHIDRWLSYFKTKGEAARKLHSSADEYSHVYSQLVFDGSAKLKIFDNTESMEAFLKSATNETDSTSRRQLVKARFECEAVKNFVNNKVKDDTLKLDDMVAILDAVHNYLASNGFVKKVADVKAQLGDNVRIRLEEIQELDDALFEKNPFLQLQQAYEFVKFLRTHFNEESTAELTARDLKSVVTESNNKHFFTDRALKQYPEIGKIRSSLQKLVELKTALAKHQEAAAKSKNPKTKNQGNIAATQSGVKLTAMKSEVEAAVTDIKSNMEKIESRVFQRVGAFAEGDLGTLEEAEKRQMVEDGLEQLSQEYAQALDERYKKMKHIVDTFKNLDPASFRLNKHILKARELVRFLAKQHGPVQTIIKNELWFLMVKDEPKARLNIPRLRKVLETTDRLTDADQEFLNELNTRIQQAKQFEPKRLSQMKLEF